MRPLRAGLSAGEATPEDNALDLVAGCLDERSVGGIRREVGPPASFALHAAAAEPGLIARKIVEPEIVAEWSILWAERAQSAAIARFLESARRCAEEHDWLPSPVPLSA
jgi:hypothetical protein